MDAIEEFIYLYLIDIDILSYISAKPICSCENGGFCSGTTGDVVCNCVGNWIGTKCTKYGWPKDAAGIASFVAQMTGCSVVVALLSVTVAAYVLMRERSPQSVLILLSDTSILIAHILIYTCRSPFIANLSELSCRIVSLCIQFFVLSHFVFLFLQSLHAYALTTNVSANGWWPLPWWLSIMFGFGLPMIIMTISVFLYFNQFNLPWACIINYKSSSSFFFILPSIAFAVTSIILSEAAGIDSRDLKRLVIQSKMEWLSAQLGQRSSVIIYFLSFTAILFTSLAIYNISVFLSTIAFALNIAFAIFLFFFHSLENPRIRGMLKKIWNLVRCRGKK